MRKSLVKCFKTWELFIGKELCQSLSDALNLEFYAEQYLNQEDIAKIHHFNQTFMPQHLPDSIRKSGLYHKGPRANPFFQAPQPQPEP